MVSFLYFEIIKNQNNTSHRPSFASLIKVSYGFTIQECDLFPELVNKSYQQLADLCT